MISVMVMNIELELYFSEGLSHASDDELHSVGEPRDDDQTIPVKAYLSGLLPSLFAGSQNTDVLSTWTGILGWSADLLDISPLLYQVETVPARMETKRKQMQCGRRLMVENGYQLAILAKA
jgi:hypothetical protein